jgi:hypothetical protein
VTFCILGILGSREPTRGRHKLGQNYSRSQHCWDSYWQKYYWASTRLPTYPPTHQPTYPPTHIPTYPPTHLPTYQPTHLPTYPPTHLPTYPPTHPNPCPPIWGGMGWDGRWAMLLLSQQLPFRKPLYQDSRIKHMISLSKLTYSHSMSKVLEV